MGASIVVYWPGISKEQLESQPYFRQDDRAWGNFMAELENAAATVEAIGQLNANEILTYKTDGLEDEDVSWVTPDGLRTAVERIKEAVIKGTPESKTILKTYQLGANKIDPIEEEFICDLDDILEMTKWAEQEGASKMTLDVNW